jgi:hypothetical protein
MKRDLKIARKDDWGVGQSPPVACPATDPLNLTFYRQAVRRLIFSDNIPLTCLDPSEAVDLDLMYPIIGDATLPCGYKINKGKLEICSRSNLASSARCIGSVNPYATYEVDIDSITSDTDHRAAAEVVIDLATLDSGTHVQIVAIHSLPENSVRVRLLKRGHATKEIILYPGPSSEPPYKFQVQLSGTVLNVFSTKDSQTRYLGRIHPSQSFAQHLDFRNRQSFFSSKFSLLTHLPPHSTIIISSARSYLSAGIGQADIRLITHRNGAPYMDAHSPRLWFTFTARGLGTGDGTQGVLSLDPSTFDLRFEGTIVLDHDDGLLRNSYAAHVFFDDQARRWRGWFSDFGGAERREGRAPPGLLVAESEKDPRRGFSVMRARVLKMGREGRHTLHEDPCGFFDARAGVWRLLTTELSAGMRARLWEAEDWEGPFVPVGQHVAHNSTGTLIQKIGKKRFVFSGSSEGAVFVYSYPELKEMGTLSMDLPPFRARDNSRVWPNIVPLPQGYPARYIALMMDRVNFPEVQGATWSYGALYLYAAHTDDVSHAGYEFDNE